MDPIKSDHELRIARMKHRQKFLFGLAVLVFLLSIVGGSVVILSSHEAPDDAYDRGFRAGREEAEQRAKKICIDHLRQVLDYHEQHRGH